MARNQEGEIAQSQVPKQEQKKLAMAGFRDSCPAADEQSVFAVGLRKGLKKGLSSKREVPATRCSPSSASRPSRAQQQPCPALTTLRFASWSLRALSSRRLAITASSAFFLFRCFTFSSVCGKQLLR